MLNLKSEVRRRREIEVVTALEKFKVLTADQIRRMDVGGLGNGGIRNVLRVLGEMEKDGLVRSRRVGVKLFSVGGFGTWEHSLIRTNFLIWKGLWRKAEIEVPILGKGDRVIARADAVWDGDRVLEVDITQKAKENRRKVEIYRRMGAKLEVVTYRNRSHMWKGCHIHYIEDIKMN